MLRFNEFEQARPGLAVASSANLRPRVLISCLGRQMMITIPLRAAGLRQRCRRQALWRKACPL